MEVDCALLYQRIGEFVVSFQWVEHRFREIGWLILDPSRREWPPKGLREESNFALVNKVEQLYLDLIDKLCPVDGAARKESFSAIAAAYHQMRTYRNLLLHSAFIELKAGGEVVGMLRSNPRLRVDPVTGELAPEGEYLSDSGIRNQTEKLAEIGRALNEHYVLLIHWLPTPTGWGSKFLSAQDRSE